MKILSIDVGIKNLAYCLFDINNTTNKEKTIIDNSNTTINNTIIDNSNAVIDNSNTVIDSDIFNIIDWNIINLCDDKHKCCFINNNAKCEKDIKCNKNAKYYINNEYYCSIHSKKTKYILPNDEITKYKKLNLDKLITLCNKYDLKYTKENKTNINKSIDNFLKKSLLKIIKYKNASDMDIINIGIAIQEKFNNISNLNPDLILIENQIGPIATKMKCIQGMITQYFIMKNMKNISFISATNKLKKYSDEKLNYSQRKKLSEDITIHILNKYNLTNWYSILEKTKKDDLADCFLQGIWFLENKNIYIL